MKSSWPAWRHRLRNQTIELLRRWLQALGAEPTSQARPSMAGLASSPGPKAEPIEAPAHRLQKTAQKEAQEQMARLEGLDQQRLEQLKQSIEDAGRLLRPLLEKGGEHHAACRQAADHAGEAQAAARGLAADLELLRLGNEEAARASEQGAVALQQLSGMLARGVAGADETAEAVLRLETAIHQIEQEARETSRVSHQASQEATRGSLAARKTIEGMRRIQRSVQQSAKVIRVLNGRSKEIGEILHVIDEVAGQTNLLAINAAIIAAQAGEQGKGFSLVAEEIRELAERTAASTKEIDSLIRAVQREASQAVDSMEEGLGLVEEGKQLSGQAGEAMDRLIERAERSSTATRTLAEAIQEQSFNAKRIAQEAENFRMTLRQISGASQTHSQSATLLARSLREAQEQLLRGQSLLQEHGAKVAAQFEAGALLQRDSELIAARLREQAELAYAIEAGFSELTRLKTEEAQARRRLDDALAGLETGDGGLSAETKPGPGT